MSGQAHDFHFTDSPLAGVIAVGSILRSGFRSDITSWSDLSEVVTAGAQNQWPVIFEWLDTTTGLMRTTFGQVGSDATDTDNGIQRANDWASSGIVWYQAGNAG
jgi:hypothetical protein